MHSMTTDGPQVSDASRVVVIPKEKAVFRLDKEGFWRNNGGKFRNKKIIDYFNRSISRDADGFFVWQDKGGMIEKVYFPYEDTALFVFDVIFEDMQLVLNTGRNIRFEPERLCIRRDNLYLDSGGDQVKFSTRALMKMAQRFEEGDDGQLILCMGDKKYEIKER